MERLKQRLDNYNKALQNVRETKNEYRKSPNKFMMMALVQAFEICFELSWKVQKDYLKYIGFDVAGPRDVIKQSFANGIIQNGDLWLEMLESRNLSTHLYDEEKMKDISDKIAESYLAEFESLKTMVEGKL